jgi:methionyl-tRNA synthetase
MSAYYGLPTFLAFLLPVMIILVPIFVFLKVYSLWHAAKRGELLWFLALMFINTLGILELVYIFGILKHTPQIILDTLQKKHHHAEHHHETHHHTS